MSDDRLKELEAANQDLRDAISFALELEGSLGVGIYWLEDCMLGDPEAVRQLKEWQKEQGRFND